MNPLLDIVQEAKALIQMYRVGAENESQKEWPEKDKFHQCKGCWRQMLILQDAIDRYEGKKP